MKNTPLTIGIALLIVGLIGVVFSLFSKLWVWLFVVLGIVSIVWVVIRSKNNREVIKK